MKQFFKGLLLSIVLLMGFNLLTLGWCERVTNVQYMYTFGKDEKTQTTCFYLMTSEDDLVYKNGNRLSASSNYSGATAKIIKVDSQLQKLESIDTAQFDKERNDLAGRNRNKLEIAGLPYNKVDFQVKNNDLIVDGMQLKNIKPADDNQVNYTISHVYKTSSEHSLVYYYVKIEDNIPHINDMNVNKLVKVKNGKLLEQIKVYDNLEYVEDDNWRSSYILYGEERLTMHKFGEENVMGNVYILNQLRKMKVIKSLDDYQVNCVGHENQKYIFSLVAYKDGETIDPNIRFVELDKQNQVKMRKETFRDLMKENKFWVYNNQIFGLSQDNQMVNNITSGKKIIINGEGKLGAFSLTNQKYTKYKLPIYKYRAKQYVCIEDLKALGYELKWDSKNKIGNWIYTGKKRAGFHKFKSTGIYDNDVFAKVDGKLLHIFNAEGYSIVCVDDLNQVERIAKLK